MATHGRIIGIWHYMVKDQNPTAAYIKGEKGKGKAYKLKSGDDEVDFILGIFPSKMRKLDPDEDLSKFYQRHIKYRTLKSDEKPENFPQAHIIKEGTVFKVADKVPEKFDGLKENDTVLMILGGSGDSFAIAMANRSVKQNFNARIFRMSPGEFNKLKGDIEKDQYPEKLIEIFQSNPDPFFEFMPSDISLVKVSLAYRNWVDAMKQRIACEARIRTRAKDVFLCSDELDPQRTISAYVEEAISQNTAMQNLIAAEKDALKELERLLKQLKVYVSLFMDIKGVGPRIAARIIVAIKDIRRFMEPAKLRSFCGVIPDKQNRLTRMRRGTGAEYNPDARQGLFLLADQFIKNGDSEWGEKLIAKKKYLKERHPRIVFVVKYKEGDKEKKVLASELLGADVDLVRPQEGIDPVIKETSKKVLNQVKKAFPELKYVSVVMMYTGIHIHKMAIWHTLKDFVNFLHQEWWKIENMRKVA